MNFSKASFSTKIICLVIVTAVVTGIASFFSAYYFLSKGFDSQAKSEISHIAKVVQNAMNDAIEQMKKQAVSLAARPDLGEAVEKRDVGYLRQIMKSYTENNGLKVLVVVDKDGVVLARGHSDKAGDSIANQENVQKAVKGETAVSIEEGAVVKLSIRAGAPVKVQDRIVGAIISGVDLSSDNTFVDGIKKQFNVECTVFHHDERVSTTLIKDGKRLIGTKMDNARVIETVLRKGETFLNVNTIQGVNYDTAYWPIKTSSGKMVGMFFIGKDRTSVEAMGRGVVWAILISVGLVGCLMAVMGYFLAIFTIKPVFRTARFINNSADEVTSASQLVASASKSLADGAAEQASAIEETSASLEEMNSMTRQNADHAEQGKELAMEARRIVHAVEGHMNNMAAAISDVSKSSEETAKIIKTIDEIAFQTNLLALNAAVEAARAGEAGAGFAVVADEVRSLAMRAAEAAKTTSSLIENTIATVQRSHTLTQQTQHAFNENVVVAGKIGQLVDEIAHASHEQAQGISQISAAVTEMDKIVQRSAVGAGESASASEDMRNQAEKMKGYVGSLLRVISGKMSNRRLP